MEEQKKRITQKDVAKLAGVSPSIVSYVINNGPRSVSDETRQRVLQAIESSGYRPNKHAQQLIRSNWQSKQTQQFGVILGGSADFFQRPFYGTILSGIYEEARANDRRIHSIQFFDDFKDPLLFNQTINQDEIFGAVFLTADKAIKTEEDEQLFERMQHKLSNIVVAERAWRDLPAVTIDLQEAACKAVSHLIDLGHSRIGYVGTQDGRSAGYRNTLFENELDYDLELMHYLPINSHRGGYEGAANLMTLAAPPTAIFAASDEVATGTMGYLQSQNYDVPEEVAVVGVDNIEQAAYLTPALTTVNIPKRELGRYAVRMLIERIDKPGMAGISMVLPTELIIRDSCGASLQL